MNQELKLQEGIERYIKSLDEQEAAKLHWEKLRTASENAKLDLARLIAASGRGAIVLGSQRFYVVGKANELVIEEFTDLLLPAKPAEET